MVRNSESGTVTLTAGGVRRGAGRLLPIAIFTLPFGIAFGVAASEAGMTSFQTITMSVLVFSGAAQFAVLDFWGAPLAFGSLAMVVLALNARHVIMGAALSPWINRLPVWQRVLTLGYLSDPNFADSQPSFQDGEKDAGVLLGGGLVLWAFWVAGTAVGAFGGNAIGDTSAFGIDVVMPCFFVSLVVARMKTGKAFAPVVTATAVSVVLLGFVPAGWNIVLAALAGGLIGALFHAE